MSELIIYAVLFLALIGHCLLAGKMYRTVHGDQNLSINEKNNWKLKALIFPAYFWKQYQNS
jgi:hypothetical protein